MSNRRLTLKHRFSSFDEAVNSLGFSDAREDLEKLVTLVESRSSDKSDVYFFVSDFVPQVSELLGVDEKSAFIRIRDLTEVFSNFDFVSVLPTESFPWLRDTQALIEITPEELQEVRESNRLSHVAGMPHQIENVSDYLRFAFRSKSSCCLEAH